MNDDLSPLATATPEPKPKGLREATENDPLAETWSKRIASARTHWEKFHKRIKHNRKLVAGLNWDADPASPDFAMHRANLIHGTITGVLPNIYARNPELGVAPLRKSSNLKLFCTTLETVTNRYLEQADLKGRGKMAVRSAMTVSYGVVKVLYQRDITEDPIIKGRIQDTQDNIEHAEGILAQLEDPASRQDEESRLAELRELMAGLQEKVEVTAAEGLVVDRVLTENLLIDPTVCEFSDNKDAPWQAQIIPMRRCDAEAKYKIKLGKATAYRAGHGSKGSGDARLASASIDSADDHQIAILEIWDKTTGTVYTMAEGCQFWLREPYRPKRVGERWYPFFLLPFQAVDGQFVGPSLVDLTEKLQKEHNDARDGFNRHRELCKPGWIAGTDVSEKTIKRYSDSELGEITLIDTEGRPLNQVIVPRQHPPMDPMVYDTSAVRSDWEQVTGMQDAARSTVVQPKTATEASIMQQALAGRVSEFRDQTEDWLQDIAKYTAEILLLELTEQQVSRIMGEHKQIEVPGPMGIMVPAIEPSYDWPQLSREDVFDMVELKIRAGSTGAPNKLDEQETWGKVLPVIQGLVTHIMQTMAGGMDADPLIAMLRETLKRFDDRLDVEQFIPKMPQPMGVPGMPGMGAGMPTAGGAAPIPTDADQAGPASREADPAPMIQ